MFKSPTINSGMDAKTAKSNAAGKGFLTAVMYLAPADASGVGNVCPMAVIAGCKAPCLNFEGRAAFTPSIIPARIAKTKRYFADRAAFMAELVRDIGKFEAHCHKHGVKAAVRLNGTSDIQWEVAHPCERRGKTYASLMEAFPEVQFYDYTKIMKRAYRALPSNYRLTLSYSGANQAYAQSVVDAHKATGLNMAVVFDSKKYRDHVVAAGKRFADSPLLDGDKTDLRFLDPTNSVVALYAKGKSAKRDTSGFMVREI